MLRFRPNVRKALAKEMDNEELFVSVVSGSKLIYGERVFLRDSKNADRFSFT